MASAVAAVRLLLLTGCRRDEILMLRWDDLDRTAGELRLRDSKDGPSPGAADAGGRPGSGRHPAQAASNPWVIAGPEAGEPLKR